VHAVVLGCSFHLGVYFIVQEGFNLAVMHIGAPACGMNAAVRSFVRNCIYRGDTALGIHDGIEGLLAGNVSVIVCFFYVIETFLM
jgi:hypothetical protein